MKNLYILLLVLLAASCSSMIPSMPSMSSPTPPAQEASTKTTQVMAETTANIWEWAWISIILVFVFPSMRAPITAFLKALFFILALPLELSHKHITMMYNQKFGSDREENKNYTKK